MSNNVFHNRLFRLNRQLAAGMPNREYLDERYFLITIVGAFMLHLTAMYIWNMSPGTQVVDIPVRALNIKLGDGDDTPEEAKAALPDAGNKNDVENAISKMVQAQEFDIPARAKPDAPDTKNNATKALDKAMSSAPNETNAMVQESAHKLANIAKQFVRANSIQASSKNGGNAAGNSSAKEAEMMSRYEQLISLWIEKFKQYPAEARAQGMHGETVVRIRIDRQGNIRYYILERSTGYQLLDRAAIEMVKRANPVPAVPHDYPHGDLIEFLIPVNFHIQ